ncbi:coiled-coil domain-containing protein 89 [Cyprinodon tularosa]|uniref:coiled-coil domain-containing protein 89 n=1 Tax=Cyprinodon tularosa TaxID=77115 RepID=UPI0018E1E78F|nr:coiled-coil domain-containing protein 89 [Cyprinodon tularosa]
MEHEENIQSPNESPQTLAAKDLGGELMLQSRIDEQSTLTCILKKRADEILLRYQALQKLNSDLEDQVAQSQKELANERKKSEILATRFTYLADNNQGIISFMKEHKNQNAKLQVENRRLQLENDSLFSKKLQDKEALVEKLVQENKLLREKCALNEKKSREILAGYESKLREKEVQHQAKEESLLKQLIDAQRKHKEALESCNDLKHKLAEAKEEHKLKEIEMTETITTLTRGKGKLLEISRERGKVIQETQEQIQKLERKLKEEEKARVQAQERFASEAETVNADRRVRSLTAALDRSTSELQELQKDFDAFKKYSANLLTQERELNQKLCHINF